MILLPIVNIPSLTLPKALQEFKRLIETAIREGGEQGKNNLIRSQKPIKLLHDVVKVELQKNGIPQDRIKPALGESNGELAVAGFLKRKDQDICVVPHDIEPHSEVLTNGLLIGQQDEFGKKYTERIVSINVRSQLSSLSKNFDTMYERTFAEALNLHLRCPRMCCGEVYLIPVYEYDATAAADHELRFVRSVQNVEKYVLGFEALNNRSTTRNEGYKGDEYKYEKVSLLLVDFSKEQPLMYTKTDDLKRDGLLPQSSPATIENLIFTDFVPHLLQTYAHRFDDR